jgi:hypothetical protein
MCFYDQKVFLCRDWKWGARREACASAPQMGESCGITLIMCSQYTNELCSTCQIIEKKQRRIHVLKGKIERWNHEPKDWQASVEVARRDICTIASRIRELDMKRALRQNRLTNTKNAYRARNISADHDS